MHSSLQTTLMVFLFFVYIGTHSSSKTDGSHGGDQAKPNLVKVDTGQPTLFNYQVIHSYPHDHKAYTQGLEFDQKCEETGSKPCIDFFWESTGLYERSSIRKVELETGKIIRSRSLPKTDFGEGITKFGTKLFQATWLKPKVYSYDKDNFDSATELKVGCSVAMLFHNTHCPFNPQCSNAFIMHKSQ